MATKKEYLDALIALIYRSGDGEFWHPYRDGTDLRYYLDEKIVRELNAIFDKKLDKQSEQA